MKERGKFNEQANGPPRDGGRLVIVVTFAMLLGVACGLWLNARLASAMESPALPAPSRPTLNAERPESAAAKPAPEESEDASAVADNPTPPAAAGESDDEKEAVRTPPRAHAGNAGGARGASNAARPTNAARPAAGEAETPGETAGRKNAPARRAASPCPLYASASALAVRDGVGATLVLGGPGRQGRVSVTTPDWADIAVFSEGAAGGSMGWMKYSVRSVSKRAGVFSVRVSGDCGSLIIPVRVVRP